MKATRVLVQLTLARGLARNQRCAETEKQAGAAWLPNRERQHTLGVSRKEEAATLFVKPQLVEML